MSPIAHHNHAAFLGIFVFSLVAWSIVRVVPLKVLHCETRTWLESLSIYNCLYSTTQAIKCPEKHYRRYKQPYSNNDLSKSAVWSIAGNISCLRALPFDPNPNPIVSSLFRVQSPWTPAIGTMCYLKQCIYVLHSCWPDKHDIRRSAV